MLGETKLARYRALESLLPDPSLASPVHGASLSRRRGLRLLTGQIALDKVMTIALDSH